MVHPKQFIASLGENGVTFFTGVPDSLLKDFIACLEETAGQENHVIAANEGGAVGIAAGYHLATGNVPAVYMQNSGMGNAINPLTSLADPEVYSIPLLLIIGWRGEPGVKDEPQHVKQGRITPSLLETLEIPYAILAPDMDAAALAGEITRMVDSARSKNRPAALVVRTGVFEPYQVSARTSACTLGREEAIAMVLDSLDGDEAVVSTTGKISRELYESRKQRSESSGRDFLTVGSMGHASQIALGIAQQKREKNVYCLDGDGAVIMHLGGLATIGWIAPRNFKHIVLNNGAYESVGGQPSAAGAIDLSSIAKSCGYTSAVSASTKEELVPMLEALKKQHGPAFLEIKVNLESRKDLGRPKESPVENKKKFMDGIGS